MVLRRLIPSAHVDILEIMLTRPGFRVRFIERLRANIDCSKDRIRLCPDLFRSGKERGEHPPYDCYAGPFVGG